MNTKSNHQAGRLQGFEKGFADFRAVVIMEGGVNFLLQGNDARRFQFFHGLMPFGQYHQGEEGKQKRCNAAQWNQAGG